MVKKKNVIGPIWKLFFNKPYENCISVHSEWHFGTCEDLHQVCERSHTIRHNLLSHTFCGAPLNVSTSPLLSSDQTNMVSLGNPTRHHQRERSGFCSRCPCAGKNYLLVFLKSITTKFPAWFIHVGIFWRVTAHRSRNQKWSLELDLFLF